MLNSEVFTDEDVAALAILTEPGIRALHLGMARASDALVPNAPMDIVEWIERNLFLPNGPRPGPVELDVIQRAVARSFQEDGSRRVHWLKPPRAGSSTLIAFVHIYFGAHEGYDTIFYERSDGDAQKWHDDRLYPILSASTALSRVLRPDSRSGVQDAWTDRYLRNGAVFQQRGVQNHGAFKAIRGFIVSLDEFGDPIFTATGQGKEGNTVGLAGRRASEYPGSKLYLGGTPTTFECGIAVEHARSDRRVLRMQFPCCEGKPQEFVRNVSEKGSRTEVMGPGLKFRCEDVEIEDPNTGVARTVREVAEIGYECAHCRAWLSETLRDDVMEIGEFVPTRRPDEPGLIGFETWAIHSKDPETRWIHIVRKYQAQLVDPSQRQDYVNLWLALPYVAEAEGKQDPSLLEQRCEVYQAPCPQQVLELYVGIDTQRGSDRRGQRPRHELVFMGVGADEQKWILARRVIDSVPVEIVDEDGVVTFERDRLVPFSPGAARQIWDMLDEEWVRPDGTRLTPARVGVDTGWEGNTAMAFCRHRESRDRKIQPFKGRKEALSPFGQRADPVSNASVKKAMTMLKLLGTFGLKDYVDLCLGLLPGMPFSFHFPIELQGTDFFAQLTSEVLWNDPKRPELTKWVKVTEQASNEVLDCVVLALGAMHVQLGSSMKTRRLLGIDPEARPLRVRRAASVALNEPRTDSDPLAPEEGPEVVESPKDASRKAVIMAKLAEAMPAGVREFVQKAAREEIAKVKERFAGPPKPTGGPGKPLTAADFLRQELARRGPKSTDDDEGRIRRVGGGSGSRGEREVTRRPRVPTALDW